MIVLGDQDSKVVSPQGMSPKSENSNLLKPTSHEVTETTSHNQGMQEVIP